MNKLWEGRISGNTDIDVDKFTFSIDIDKGYLFMI